MASDNIDPQRERRKIRKGNRSCWECKRRKIKCTYASPTDEVCIGCNRRCMECVSQHFPEQATGPSSQSRLVGDRIGRIETMIHQLAEQVFQYPEESLPQPRPTFIADNFAHSAPASTPRMARDENSTLSQTLLAVYPSPEDMQKIRTVSESLPLYLQMAFVTRFHTLERAVAIEMERLWAQYTADTKPVLIARQMLMLAGILQHAGRVRCQQLSKLSRPAQALASQLAEAATTLVTAHSKFIDTLEGLECLWLEIMYHERNGNLRQSWLACRRAISAAQLMGLHRQPLWALKSVQPNREADLQQAWLQLLYAERALCLVLGMPSASPDTFTCVDLIATEDGDTTKLDRRHAGIAGHLLERSEHGSNFEDFDTAHQLHIEVEESATAMPRGWWRTPSLADATSEKYLFCTMKKLRAQIFHSYLLLHVHIPSMLQACGEPANEHHQNHLPSRDICIEASRDLLHRFVKLRSCDHTASFFMLLDHYAWLAATTLLLTRLDGHQTFQGPDHQHVTDRAIVSRAMKNMRLEEDGKAENTDGVDRKCVLSRLLAMDATGAPVEMTFHKRGTCPASTGFIEDQEALILSIPLVGFIYITQKRGNVAGGCSLPGTMSSPVDVDDEESHSEHESSLERAIKLRRSTPWQMGPYMTRPIS